MNSQDNLDRTPTPEFKSHLEWQIRTELRRRTRFAPVSEPRRWSLARRAALVIVWVLVGAGATLAADRMQSSQRKALLLEQARVRLELAEAIWEVAHQEQERLAQALRAGITDQGTVLRGQSQLAIAEGDVQLRSLNLEEIRLSGREPYDQLSSADVRGRDFVTERLQVRLETASLGLESARREYDRREQLRRAAVASESQVRDASLVLLSAEREFQQLSDRIDLRGAFLRGDLTATEVEREGARVEARRAIEFHGRELEAARRNVEAARLRLRSGVAPSSEVRRAEAQLLDIETNLRLAELQLRLVDTPKED